MSPLVLVILLSASCVFSVELNPENKENAREEKLRSALIDAFQSIKKASAKGGIDDESTSGLIGSMIPSPNSSRNTKSTTEDSFNLFADDDGLTFAEAFGNVEPERRTSSTEKAHNVQHIVKTTKQMEKTTSKPNRDVLTKLSDSIRTTVNESRMQMKLVSNETDLLGLESMLRVLDAEILVNQWSILQKAISGQCKEDMEEYVNGLKERSLWAMKSK